MDSHADDRQEQAIENGWCPKTNGTLELVRDVSGTLSEC